MTAREGLRVVVDVPGAARRWLRRSIEGFDAKGVDLLLAALPLADGMRLLRALAPFFLRASRDEVEALTAALAFEHRIMSLAEADALDLPDLAYTCARLADHLKRRSRAGRS